MDLSCTKKIRLSAFINAQLRSILAVILFLLFSSTASAQQFTAKSLGDYGNVTVMEVSGNYDEENADGSFNTFPRQIIAREFFKTHKDEYDFLVIFTNFDFALSQKHKEALGFYSHVKNDTQGLGLDVFNNTSLYGSNGKLQGTIDMKNIAKIASDPLDAKFADTLSTLSHEIMHRWASYVKFRDANGNISTALLGRDSSHWSFLLDSGGSLMYGNTWQNNGNGTFTTTTPQSQMKFYSPLELYLMGMIDKSKVPPMLLITNPDVDTTQLPESGITINGTAQYVTIDQIIAANGPRIPNASASQKSFKTAFIFVTRPNTFTGSEIYGIENIRNGAVTRFSILTDGQGLMQVASTTKDNIPSNPGPLPPSTTPRTLPPNINEGVTWLVNNQKTDGSWIDVSQTMGRDTAAATLTLKDFSSGQQNYQSGLLWLGSVGAGAMDFSSRRIVALIGSNQDATPFVQDLVSRQNSDGGWGSEKTYASNPLDTALALKALSVAGYNNQSVLSPAFQYLKSSQQLDGGWTGNHNSTIQATANVLSVFNGYQQTVNSAQQSANSYQLTDNIAKATAWLVSKQNVDGGFGNSPSTVYDTALAIQTLRELNVTTDITNRSITYLLGQQFADGSWNASVYQTALAVAAVYKGTVDPDLSIKPENITIIPATITSLPANIVISADIWNLGETAAQAKVALYDGDPAQGKKLGEQTLVFSGQSSTTVTFSAVVKDGSEYRFFLVIDPDKVVRESNKLNNTAIKVLSPEGTYDFEVLSSDITLSANTVGMQQDVTITSRIANKGTMNAYNVQVKYYIDDPVTPFEIATQTIDIPSGATVTNTTTWRANKAGTNMPLTVMVDQFNNFNELSETNNKASTTITVNPDTRANLTNSYKDIVITPNPANERGTATIATLVKNEGATAANNVSVNFYRGVPGQQETLLLGTQTIPSLASGQTASISVTWQNIQESGEKIIYIKVDPDNQIDEIRKDDNDAFTTLNILSLPDFTLAQNSITFSPAAPKDGDPVRITVLVQNRGEQPASNVPVRVSERSTVLGNLTIPSLAGNSTGTVSLTYDASGKGSHTITATIDPDNTTNEQSKNNNSASNTFGVQDSNLWVTEPYFSPNGDGIKDTTQFFFNLGTPTSVAVAVVNSRGETVRTFNGPELQNISAGNVIWDGLNNDGTLVPDGQYQLQVKSTSGAVLGSLLVTLDTNRSPLTDAIGTKYLINNNVTCNVPPSLFEWLPNEGGVLFAITGPIPQYPDFPAGTYIMSPQGSDIHKITPGDWTPDNPDFWYGNFNHYVSADEEKIIFTFTKRSKKNNTGGEELWVMDIDGNNRFPVIQNETQDIYDVQWSPDSHYIVYSRYQELWLLDMATLQKTLLDKPSSRYYYYHDWSKNSQQISYISGYYDESGNYVEDLVVVDKVGNKRTIYRYSGAALTKRWIAENRILVSQRNTDGGESVWLIDTTGSGDHRKLSEDAIYRISPNDSYIAVIERTFFMPGGYYRSNITIFDNTGRAVMDYQNAGSEVVSWWNLGESNNIYVWSPDSRKLALMDFRAESADNCSLLHAPYLVILEPTTHEKKEFKMGTAGCYSNQCAYSGQTQCYSYGEGFFGIDVFLADGINFLSPNSNGPVVVNSETGKTMGYIPTNTWSVKPSPKKTYFTYEYGPYEGNSCSRGLVYEEDLWVVGSLLNLTANLRIVRDGSGVILKGTAADINFEGYQLEYADVKNPDTWIPVAPSSNVPVVNGTFTTWVPPYEGTFYVRLSVWDKAGNTAYANARISSMGNAGMVNVYTTSNIFSPNGGGRLDRVELHYHVLRPVHLEFNIYNENNSLIKTFKKDHTISGDDFISWDGKDDTLNAVPDGIYRITVLDYNFTVIVDNTPPAVSLQLSQIKQMPITTTMGSRPGPLAVELSAKATDINLKSWVVEYGYGDNPQEWFIYSQGSLDLVGESTTASMQSNTAPDKIINQYVSPSDIISLINKKFRLTAEDMAGNKKTVVTSYLEELVVIYSDANDSENPCNFELKRAPGAALFEPMSYKKKCLQAYPLKVMDTVRAPITGSILEYALEYAPSETARWSDGISFTYSADHRAELPQQLPDSLIRARIVDTANQERRSNVVFFGAPPKCGKFDFQLSVTPNTTECNTLASTANLSVELKPAATIKSLSYYIEKANGDRSLLKSFDGHLADFAIDTRNYPEGVYPITVVASIETGECSFEVTAKKILSIDRVLPTAKIVSLGQQNERICSTNSCAQGDCYNLPMVGIANDTSGQLEYSVFYGSTADPLKWTETKIKGTSPQNGIMGTLTIPAPAGTTVPVKLKVTDKAGNVSCDVQSFTAPSLIPYIASISVDKDLFSPNGDGISDYVRATYEIQQPAVVDVKVFKLSDAVPLYTAGLPLIKTLIAGQGPIVGIENIQWNGQTDAGVVAADGKYAIVVFVTDSCGYTSTKWIAVEIDNTAPAVAVRYPQSGSTLGTMIEIKGFAIDKNFKHFLLTAEDNANPGNIVTIASNETPVADGVLGKWNSYNCFGIWTLRLTAFDKAENKSEFVANVRFDDRQKLIKNFDVSPSFFSPNADGKADTVIMSYEVSAAASLQIDIMDSLSVIRRTITHVVPSSGLYAHVWDGKDNAGIAVADGAFSVRLSAVLSSNTTVTQTETVTTVVDTTLPLVDIKQPLNNSYTPATDIFVNGTIDDLDLSHYSINLTGASGSSLFDQATQSRGNYNFGTLSNLAEGHYTLAVKATDLGQNETNKTIAFTVDRTPPVVKLDAPGNNEYHGTIVTAATGTASSQPLATVNITGSIVEKNLDTFNLRYGLGDAPTTWMDLASGTSVTAYPSPFTWKVGKNDGIPDGVYTLSLYAKDKAGLTAETKLKVIVDNTPPTTAITSLHDGDYVKQAVDIRGTAFDLNLDKYTIDFSEGQCASAFKWSTIKTGTTSVQDNVLATWQALPPDGDYCVRLTAIDKVGSSAEAKVSVKVDTHPPAAPVLSGQVDSKVNAALSWTKNTEPDLAGYNLYRAGQKVNTTLITDIKYLDQNLAEGVYTYTVKAQDFAGWESVASNEVKIKIDLTGPDARIRVPQDGARISSLNDIKGTAYSADDFKQYRIYIGQGQTPSTWVLTRTSPVPMSYGTLAPWDTLGLAEGQVYSIKLEAEDISGNITSHQVSVTIDNTPPAAPLLLTASAIASDATVTWRANTESDLAGYLVYRNDQLANVSGIVVGNLSPYLVKGTSYPDKALPDGTYKYYLIAMDTAGNMSDQSNTLSVTIDTRPPHATITDPTDTSKFGGKIVVKAESPDLDIASVQFQYQSIKSSPTTTTDWLNIGSPVTSATMVTYLDPPALNLAYGDYRLRAVATDKGNKTDPAPGFITVTYTDLTPPAAPQGLAALVSAGTVTLTWTPNTEGDLAGYNVYRGGQKINTAIVTSPVYRDENLYDGTYAYTITAIDKNQNESKASNTANAIIYTPVITQPYTPVGQSSLTLQGNNAAANSTVSLFSSTTGTGIVSLGTTTADVTGKFTAPIVLNPGENRLTARSIDSLGNVSKDAAMVVVVLNDTPTAPTGLAATAQNLDVHLTWNPNPETDILGYNIFRDGVKTNKSSAVLVSDLTITASSSISNQHTSSMAMDGSLDSYWMPTTGTSTATPSWWEIDLAVPELISHVELHWGTDVDASGKEVMYVGKDYEIQVWSGYAWITQVKVTGNTVKDNVFDFKPSYRTDKIRIFITDSTDVNTAKQIRLAEVNVLKDNLAPSDAQPTYDDLNVKNNHYSYAITAVDNYGFESPLSSAVTATIAAALPVQPILSVTSPVEGGLNASWVYNGSPGARFNLYRSLTSGGPYTKVSSSLIAGNVYFDSDVMVGVVYYYVVTAIDAIGNEGNYSNEAFGSSIKPIVLAKPVIFFPTVTGMPITAYKNTTEIIGSAEPGALVTVTGNGTMVGTVQAQLNDAVQTMPLNYDGNIAALSPDGKTLAYTNNGFIRLKSVVTGAETQAVQADGHIIAWSPDGKKFAYNYSYGPYGNYRISIYDMASGNSTALTNDVDVSENYSSWSTSGYKLFFTQEGGASAGVFTKDLGTGAVTQVLAVARKIDNPQPSPDGTKLAYFDGEGLYLYDLVSKTTQTIDSNTDGWSNQWSPDGKTLAFVSNRNGNGDVYLFDTTTGNQLIVPGSSGYPYYVSWTPDGKSILFDIWDNTNNRDTLWMADVGTLSQPSRIMPDFQSLYYVGSSKSGVIAFIGRDLQGGNTLHLLNPQGTFSLSNVSLSRGENIFTATASNTAGNKSDSSDPISVTLDTRMFPDLAITTDDLSLYPPYPIVGEKPTVNAVVRNTSSVDISNVDVAMYIWNAVGQLETLKTETIPLIAAGSSAVITTTWNSSGKTGDNRLIVVVDPSDKIGESDETNNMAIKDFYVADKIGVSMSTTLDALQYTSTQNANITVTTRNTGPVTNAVLLVQIEDANGYPVFAFDSRSMSLAYATEIPQSFIWSTGSTFAGSYRVHSILRDGSGALLAENTTAFTIVPDMLDDVTVVTDKIAYGPSENVITSFTIKNTGKNYIIPSLQAKASILDASGTVLFTATKTATNLLPGASVDLSSIWNTGLMLPGNYSASVEVSFDGGVTVTKTAAFKINTLLVLSGTITASPTVVPVGNTTQVTYTMTNSGNADLVGATARITIIDPETQTVMQTQDVAIDIAKNSSKSGQIAVNTTGYNLKTYMAVLQAVNQGVVKNIANTPFTVKDLTPPTVTIITPAANSIFTAAVGLSVLATDNASGVDHVEYRLDSGLWSLLALADPTQGRFGTTWNPLSSDAGSHTISFRATDKAGNTSAPVSVTITIQNQPTDTTPPTGSIEINDNAAYTNNPAVSLTLACSDTESGCAQMQFSIDNATWSAPEPYAGGKTWELSTGDGQKTVYVKYIDNAGNVSTAYSASITLDTTPPVLTVSTLRDGSYTNNATLNIAGTVTDNIEVQGVRINNTPVIVSEDGTFSQAFTLVSGPNVITTIASDMAGNTTTDTRTIILDQTAPVVSITYPHDNSILSRETVTVTGSVDKPATVSIKLNDGTAVPVVMDGLNFSLPVTLIYGQNTIEATAIDPAGNIGTAKRTVIFDDEAPSLAVTNPAQDITTNQPNLLLQGTVADLTDITVTVTFNGIVSTATVTAGTFQQPLTFTDEKTYPIIVTATDAAGNTSTVQRNVIFDKTPPAVTINPVTTPTNIVNQQIGGTMDAGATVSVSCSTATVGVVSYPTATAWQAIISSMTEGDNLINVTAADQVGNVSAPVTATIVLDLTAPDTIITGNPPALTNINGAGFTFSSTEANSTFECSVDQAAYAPCATPVNFINLIDGAHTFNVRATDAAGNTDQTPATYTWVVDTIPPVAVVTGMPQSPTRTTGAVLSVGGADVVSYRYKIDSGGYSVETPINAPIVITNFIGGTHVVSVVGKDSANNWQKEEYATVVSWIVDLTPPVLTLSTLPNGAYTNNDTLNISGTVTDNVAVQGVTINGTSVTINPDTTFSQALKLVSGPNTITTMATDTAGNTATDVRTINLDQKAPVVTIIDPVDNSITNNPNYLVRGSIDKPGTVSIKLNNGPEVPAVMDGLNFTLLVTLTYGQNTIEAKAIDLVGNVGTAKRTVLLDNINPALAVTYPAQDISTNQASLVLQGTVSDLTGVTVTITHDGTTYSPTVSNGTFQQQLTFSTEKLYPVIVAAMDVAGNTSTVQRNIIYDKTPPALTINPVSTPTNVVNQQISGTMEAGATISVTCSTAMVGLVSYPTATTWQTIIADMAEGNNTISATATDQLGNTSAPVTAAILVDTHAPVTTPTPGAGTYTSGVSVSLSTNETSTIYYSVNGSDPTTSSSVYTAPIIITTATTLKFFAIDIAGNREAIKSAVYTMSDDITPPVTTITAGTPNYTAQNGKLYVTSKTVFTLSATDDQSGVAKTEYHVDCGSWKTYTPFSISSQGSHVISYRSKDKRGNVEAIKTLTVIVDNTAPVTTISISNTKCQSNITPASQITLAATDTMSGVQKIEYNIDNGAWTAYTGVFTLAGYAEGKHTINYRSSDNVGNQETTKTKTVTLSKKATAIIYTGPTLIAEGRAATLSATLKLTDGTALNNQTITFTIAGTTSQSCTGATDAQGKASCSINPVTVPTGPVTITAKYSGDTLYKPSSSTSNGIVFAYAATGVFVIGDKNARLNKSVTFWGSKWSKNNTLSNGSAPSSFKGYANTTTPNPPDCKGTWTTDPGNSSEPPGSVPSYLAVIAASNITKSGSTISGNAAKIVIIKTNSGYGPDPGHSGTGTVVGILCGDSGGCGH